MACYLVINHYDTLHVTLPKIMLISLNSYSILNHEGTKKNTLRARRACARNFICKVRLAAFPRAVVTSRQHAVTIHGKHDQHIIHMAVRGSRYVCIQYVCLAFVGPISSTLFRLSRTSKSPFSPDGDRAAILLRPK